MNYKNHVKQPTQNSDTSLHSIIKPIGVSLLIVILAVGIAHSFYYLNQFETHPDKQNTFKYALIGDIGGTNIRYQLVSFFLDQNLPLEVIKQQRLKVRDYETFQNSVTVFLSNILPNTYPNVAVIAVAGPINENSVSLPNVPKWGQLVGGQLANRYNLSQFLFINDFQAVSYGLLIANQSQFISLNNKTLDPNKIRGVIGPGTGLGHSIIFNHHQLKDVIIVLPSEAGHSDLPFIDQESLQYVDFLKKKVGRNYVDLQKAFCGPSLPIMFQFFSKKLGIGRKIDDITSEQIVQNILKENPGIVQEKVFEQFMKFYSSAIANFMIQHMTTGGVYLVGSLTKGLLSKIKGTDVLKDWKLRHPEMVGVIEQIPLVFCQEVDLGLKGAFVMANRLSKSSNKIKRVKQQSEQIL